MSTSQLAYNKNYVEVIMYGLHNLNSKIIEKTQENYNNRLTWISSGCSGGNERNERRVKMKVSEIITVHKKNFPPPKKY